MKYLIQHILHGGFPQSTYVSSAIYGTQWPYRNKTDWWHFEIRLPPLCCVNRTLEKKSLFKILLLNLKKLRLRTGCGVLPHSDHMSIFRVALIGTMKILGLVQRTCSNIMCEINNNLRISGFQCYDMMAHCISMNMQNTTFHFVTLKQIQIKWCKIRKLGTNFLQHCTARSFSPASWIFLKIICF